MLKNNPRSRPKQLRGSDSFVFNGSETGYTVLDFWQWSTSDLVSNATRGCLAEFIVAKALGISTDSVRNEWAPYDLEYNFPGHKVIKIEVKSAAYVQSWAQKKPSSIIFSVRPARAWDPETNRQAANPERTASVYVFALLKHMDKSTINPLNLDQWEFYVLPTPILNKRARSQSSITLNSLRKLEARPYNFESLKAATLRAADVRDE